MIAAMPRPPRPIADGLIYHVINRGNNRQPVFLGEGDYVAFLGAIADLKERKPFELFGYWPPRDATAALVGVCPSDARRGRADRHPSKQRDGLALRRARVDRAALPAAEDRPDHSSSR